MAVGPQTGLTEEEAKVFQRVFMAHVAAFGGASLIVHFLIWNWRPWF
jgi:light-harvesting complex 1 beta chain